MQRRTFLQQTGLATLALAVNTPGLPKLSASPEAARTTSKALRVGVVGLVHTHVHWILGRPKADDLEIVGIVEPNRDLARRYVEQHGYDMGIVFDTIEEMVAKTRPEAVTAFNSIFDHLSTVAYCAPRGIHVMVEKPLAVSWNHAQRMAALAGAHNIHLLTNYETTWYGSNARAYHLIHEEKAIGPLRKLVFHHGHPGPIEIGCNPEFLDFLTDPVRNGGGALTDFGCYGANLATWLLEGRTPDTVYCVTRQIKPDKYPKVDDDATILLTYPQTQVIIQASWNWPYSRKDMEAYGQHGVIECLNGEDMLVAKALDQPRLPEKAAPLPQGSHDPFAYLAGIVHGQIKVQPHDLSALENNLIVMQILEAAKQSARTGKPVVWKKFYR